MKRFTVSLPDDSYAALRTRGDESTPPASLQQMVRFAVDAMLDDPQEAAIADGPAPQEPRAAVDPVDLLVFSVGDVTYGLPIKSVETVAAGLEIHSVPTTSPSQLGVAAYRGELTDVHDGGMLLQGEHGEENEAMLAIPSREGRALMTVTAVFGLSAAAEAKWANPPPAAPDWVAALTWNDDRVVTVIDPQSFNL